VLLLSSLPIVINMDQRTLQRMHDFGREVRMYRLAKGWSQDELARRSGLHRAYVGSVERGDRNATLATVWSLADALDVEPGLLVRPVAPELTLLRELTEVLRRSGPDSRRYS
jgi:transcriptional regulator with XRE-family HTH domain